MPKRRLYYGWVVVAVAFVTMGIGVNTRTSFSLLYPAILDEFGWERGATAGIFAFGFLASVLINPFVGILMERYGPRILIPCGAVLVASGLILTTVISSLFGLYLTLGVLTVGGSVFFSYIGHSVFLPNWFVRRRGLVLGITFSGVGVGGIVLFPLLQGFIESAGWRQACIGLAVLMLVTIVPLNAIAQRRRPEDLGLRPDGDDAVTPEAAAAHEKSLVADPSWAAIEWTYRRILTEPRFWALAFAYVFSLYNFYAVQVHQTRYFIEVGFAPAHAALGLGLVGFTGIAGQIAIGYFSDRVGREWGWAVAMIGYYVGFLLLLQIGQSPSLGLMYITVGCIGLLGAGTGPLFSAIATELFAGPYFGRVYGLLSVATAIGAGLGAWFTGVLYDWFGRYDEAFVLSMLFALLSAGCVWLAGPGRVRPVAGRRGH